MHLLVCFLSDSFSRWSWSTRGRGLSTLCEACASFVVVWLCSFCYVVWLQMQKNFHHATILQFISSLFLSKDTENWKLRGNAAPKKKKKSPRPLRTNLAKNAFIIPWRMEFRNSTLSYKITTHELTKKYSTKGSNFFVEWHIDFMFVRVRIAKNGCEFSCSACNLKPPWQPPIFINWKITDILPPADP